MKIDICAKCGKALEVGYRTKIPHVSVSISSAVTSGESLHVFEDLCADCFNEAPGGREFLNHMIEIHGNPPQFVRPTGKIMIEPEYTSHGYRCAFKNYGVCTCGLLETLESFPYRDTWYPPFQAEWDKHVATLTGDKKAAK